MTYFEDIDIKRIYRLSSLDADRNVIIKKLYLYENWPFRLI